MCGSCNHLDGCGQPGWQEVERWAAITGQTRTKVAGQSVARESSPEWPGWPGCPLVRGKQVHRENPITGFQLINIRSNY